MAQAFKDYGEFEKAENLFLKALTLDPHYFHTYHLRGIARFSAGDHRGSLTDLNSSLRINPSHEDTLHMRGVVKHGLVISIKNFDIN